MAAATDWRTLIWFGAGVAAAAALSNPFPALIGLAAYLWALQRLLASPAFVAAGEKARTASRLADRYRLLKETVAEVNQGFSKAATVGGDRSWLSRADAVIAGAREIYEEWLAHPDDHAQRTPLVEQAVQMAYLYLRILRSYHAVYAGPNPIDPDGIRARLERNRHRLAQVTDMEARRDLSEAIEMDEWALRQAAEENAERERYQAQMTAIESAMEMLRRQAFSPDAGGEGEGLHDLLVEAEAMENALAEVQQRARVRARA